MFPKLDTQKASSLCLEREETFLETEKVIAFRLHSTQELRTLTVGDL